MKAFDTPFISLDETNIEMASILFLFLAVMMIAQIRRRRQLVRHLVQIVSFAVFFWLIYSCLGVFGMIRNGLYGVKLIGSVYSESFYWMALPVVVMSVTLVAGPVFCSWICPTGTIQELSMMLRRVVLKPRKQRTRIEMALLGLFLCVAMALTIWLGTAKQMFVEDSSLHWAAALILTCYLVLLGVIDDIPTRSLRLVSVLAIVVTTVSQVAITSPVHFAFTSRADPASALSTLVIACAAMVVARGWCRYLCPWGYLMGLLHRFSRLKIVRRESQCNSCDKCARSCDVAAIDARGIRHQHCQFCFNCIDACPKQALEVVNVWHHDAAPLVPSDCRRDAPSKQPRPGNPQA